MPSDKFIAYYYAAAGVKGRRDSSLERQRAVVMSYLNGGHWTLLERHTEKPGARRHRRRPALGDALVACRTHNAALVVAEPEYLAEDEVFRTELDRAGVECWVVEQVPFATPRARPLGRR